MARTQVAICSQMSTINGDDSIMIWDIVTGNLLSSYKSSSLNSHNNNNNVLIVPRHSIGLIDFQYVICGYLNSPILTVWSLDRKDHLYMKMILPGNIGALCVSHDGRYCLVAIGTKLYIWQTSSGYLLNILDKHYQMIRVIRITDDMSYFVTGGDDGMLMIWNVAKVFTQNINESFHVIDGQSSHNEPEHIISNSPTAVIDIHMGKGGPNSRFATCAEQSCKVKLFHLKSGKHLASISFPSAIFSVLMDRIEQFLFCGSSDGDIYQVQISHIESEFSMMQKSTDGSSTAHVDFSSADEEQTPNHSMQKFKGHTNSVCSMALTIDGQGLISGSNDRTIRVWHLLSHQCMRTIPCKGPISNIMVQPSMAGLFFFDSLESSKYSLNNITSSNQTDISFFMQSTSTTPNGKQKKKTPQKIKFGYSRPQSVEQTLQTVPNPPIPISTFQRDIFRCKLNPIQLVKKGTTTTTTNTVNNHVSHAIHVQSTESEGLYNAFDQGGHVWIRNNRRDGKEFWPWSDFTLPDIRDDLPRIYPQQQFIQEEILIEKRNDAKLKQQNDDNNNNDKSKSRKLMKNSNELQDDFNNSGKLFLEEKIANLHNINYDLYRYAIEEIFNSNENNNSHDDNNGGQREKNKK